MSIACISYGSLKNASSEAKHVADKLNKYADHLHSQIYEKLDSYGGQSTDYIEQAMKNVSAKIVDLRGGADSYEKYSSDLSELKNKCVDTDKTVRSKVSELTASFKANNGIKDSNVKNSINYFFTSVGNMNSGVRWLNDKRDKTRSSIKHRMQSIEDWWDYEGGAQCVKGIAVAGLGTGIAFCTVVGAVLTGGALCVVIASAMTGVIALSNGVANFLNEVAAYDATKKGDPATGCRRRDINTWQDYLRSSFIYTDKGMDYDKNTYKKSWDIMATGIDVVNIVCTTIAIVDGIGKLTKNVYKWTTGSMADVKNLRLKNIVSKENFSAFKIKVKTSILTGISEINCAIKHKNFMFIKELVFDMGDDFINNLKNTYTFAIFSEDKKLKDFVKHGADLMKNYASIIKMVVSDGISFGNLVGNVGLKTLVLKNINIAEVVTYKGGEGVFAYNIDSIKVKDITNVLEDIIDCFSDISSVIKKLSNRSNISIRIPDIQMPKVSGINYVYI